MTRAPIYCQLSDMLSLNGELGKIQDLPKRQAIFPPHQLAAVRKAEKAATDSNISYATSGDGASVRVGYANTSDLVSDILELVA